jgi:hypothetical protein
MSQFVVKNVLCFQNMAQGQVIRSQPYQKLQEMLFIIMEEGIGSKTQVEENK